MKSKDESRYRLNLAEGFLTEAEQDFELSRWRSCVDNSQLAVENTGKTIVACFRPVEKSHNPAKQVMDLLKTEKIDEELIVDIKDLIPLLDKLGFEEHLKTDYGDEDTYKSPWDIFKEDDATEALETARKCVKTAKRVYKFYFE
ncbi:HEPN domain protein [uncultured archaeon]|nr:HEPN domain protein [uncultured archaeon]